MTNGERAARLIREARRVAAEMRSDMEAGDWNLSACRAQEVVELVIKAILAALSVDYPRTHDPAPVLAQAMRARGLEVDPAVLEWLLPLSARLAEIRGPAFYQEIDVSEVEARTVVQGAERVLDFGRGLLPSPEEA